MWDGLGGGAFMTFGYRKQPKQLRIGWTQCISTGSCKEVLNLEAEITAFEALRKMFFSWIVVFFDFPCSCASHKQTCVSYSFPPPCETFQFFCDSTVGKFFLMERIDFHPLRWCERRSLCRFCSTCNTLHWWKTSQILPELFSTCVVC